jgi:hypothetical protein
MRTFNDCNGNVPLSLPTVAVKLAVRIVNSNHRQNVLVDLATRFR